MKRTSTTIIVFCWVWASTGKVLILGNIFILKEPREHYGKVNSIYSLNNFSCLDHPAILPSLETEEIKRAGFTDADSASQRHIQYPTSHPAPFHSHYLSISSLYRRYWELLCENPARRAITFFYPPFYFAILICKDSGIFNYQDPTRHNKLSKERVFLFQRFKEFKWQAHSIGRTMYSILRHRML